MAGHFPARPSRSPLSLPNFTLEGTVSRMTAVRSCGRSMLFSPYFSSSVLYFKRYMQIPLPVLKLLSGAATRYFLFRPARSTAAEIASGQIVCGTRRTVQQVCVCMWEGGCPGWMVQRNGTPSINTIPFLIDDGWLCAMGTCLYREYCTRLALPKHRHKPWTRRLSGQSTLVAPRCSPYHPTMRPRT
jgi:hypothetical protein